VLNDQHLALADAAATRMAENAANLGPNPRYAHTPDQRYQRVLGMQGEVAFRVVTGLPLPTVDELTSTWKDADVDGYAVKTISKPTYDLRFDDSDLPPAHTLVLMLNQSPPRIALLGTISIQRALAVRRWGKQLPRPTWLVDKRYLEPWPLDDRFVVDF